MSNCSASLPHRVRATAAPDLSCSFTSRFVSCLPDDLRNEGVMRRGGAGRGRMGGVGERGGDIRWE